MATQKNFTLIFYIVPQDNDEIEVPNAFGYLIFIC